MKKMLSIYIFFISTISLLLFFVFTIRIINNNNLKMAEDSLENYTKIYHNSFLNNELDKIIPTNDIRITIIDKSGVVIFESKNLDTDSLDNHLDREEIIAAQNNRSAFSVRHSDTADKRLMYYALVATKDNDDYFIRSAIPLDNISKYIYQSAIFLFMILITIIILSLILTNKLNKKLLVPFNIIKNNLTAINDNLDLDDQFSDTKYDEVNQILSEINELNNKIKNNIQQIQSERSKLNFIINNINDGIFAIDNESNIVLINKTIQEIFSIENNILGKNLAFLTSNKKLFDSIKDFIINKKITVTFELEHDNKYYLVNIKNIKNKWKENNYDQITVIILSDISQIKNNERMRSEFFANASHELKTPLTSIIGFNDLSEIKNTDPIISNYINQISIESHRMLSLIEDMLSLSLLENYNTLDLLELSLSKISIEVKESLHPIIAKKNINFLINGDAKVKFNYKHLFQLIKNLAENSIKYNNDNGSVIIDIFMNKNNKTILKITDTGIGIDKKYHFLIFQRFYRIDKSRSKQNGGTGLGLAIVKHICLLYHIDYFVESEINKGTAITLVFNPHR